MELNELKHTWENQHNDLNDYTRSELVTIVNNKLSTIEQQIKSRDRREIIACVIMIIFFSFVFFTANSVWHQAGSMVIILSAFFIWFKLKTAQRQALDQERSANRSLREHLKFELQMLREQKKLLKDVVWWYILPLCIGLILFAISFGLLARIIYIAVVVLVGLALWKINRRAAKREFDPILKEIKEALRSLDEDKNK
jgi:Flp pilus assembly protein TadB